MSLEENNLILYMERNKLVLNNNFDNKMSEHIGEKVVIKNILAIHQLARKFAIQTLYRYTFNYLERSFTMLVENPHFVALDYVVMEKLLASSGLNVTSELEVYNAANKWLSYIVAERKIFAYELLLKVRLQLVSEHALKYLLNNASVFTSLDVCVAKLKETSELKNVSIQNKRSVKYTHRFCDQNKFKILICGGKHDVTRKPVKRVHQIDGSNLNNLKVLPSMLEERQYAKAVCLKGEVYVFGGKEILKDRNLVMSVEKYSPVTNTWSKVTYMYDERYCFCVCAFMDKLFIIGGSNRAILNSCLQFDTKDNAWKHVAGMSQARVRTACVVFKENIIVAGGVDTRWRAMRSVESYDAIADEWSPMPDMINVKVNDHSLVVVKSKLYVIGYGVDNCEVFDETFKKFISLKSVPKRYSNYLSRVVSIGSKIFKFQSVKVDRPYTVCYDVDTDEWTDVPFDAGKDVGYYTCVKVPW